MFKVIQLGDKWGWYETDADGNTVREGTELFPTQDAAQTHIDKLAGKDIEKSGGALVLSDPAYKIVALGTQFGWYQEDLETGSTVQEGKEFFATSSEVQKYLNEHFPAVVADAEVTDAASTTDKVEIGHSNGTDAAIRGDSGKTAETATDTGAGSTTDAGASTEKVDPMLAFTNDGKDPVTFPYELTEGDLEKFPVLTVNGFAVGATLDTEEALVMALTPAVGGSTASA